MGEYQNLVSFGRRKKRGEKELKMARKAFSCQNKFSAG
jgi:hypothetical protein